MLTEVKAYSSWPSAPSLLLENSGRAETDLIQIRNIEGLDPVKASVNTSPYGSVDGTAYIGGSVLSRNIVLTIHPNPDWDLWSHEALRKLLYSYFMPKRQIRLVFYSDEMDPVEIIGVVEEVSPNIFSSDPEFQVSIICPDPYFKSLNPITVFGQSIREGGTVTDIDYNGTIEAGIEVVVNQTTDPAPTYIRVQIGDALGSYLLVDTTVDATKYFKMSSVPMQKYVRTIAISDGVITNLLNEVQEGSSWPALQLGENHFSVITDAGVQDWELTYYERFGGL